MTINVYITGATGYLGSNLARKLVANPMLRVTCVVRSEPLIAEIKGATYLCDPNYLNGNIKSELFKGADVVIHCAARCHINEWPNLFNSKNLYYLENTLGTKFVLENAAQNSVHRFIFISTIKVNGEANIDNIKFTAKDISRPSSDYGRSKKDAEEIVKRIGFDKKIDYLIIRPPLIYGRNSKANFNTLLNLIYYRIPLPFLGLENSKSLIYIDNLIDFIEVAATTSQRISGTVLVSDGDEISTVGLIRKISALINKNTILFRMPNRCLGALALILGKTSALKSLTSNLVVDSANAELAFGWRPKYSIDEALKLTCREFLASKNTNKRIYTMFKRVFDIFLSIIVFILLSPLILLVGALVIILDGLPIFYTSKRVGINGDEFVMPKFRTMKTGAPQVATHLLPNPDRHLTKLGKVLRSLSLDELPQLWSIFIGDMSFVGPRPALFNQTDLINMRMKNGVDLLPPGLTGWAQVNGRDELAIADKIFYEVDYLRRRSFIFDLYILYLTFIKVVARSGVSH